MGCPSVYVAAVQRFWVMSKIPFRVWWISFSFNFIVFRALSPKLVIKKPLKVTDYRTNFRFIEAVLPPDIQDNKDLF
jgi:hypothetical protein